MEQLLIELLSLDKHPLFLMEFAPECLELREHIPGSFFVLFRSQWAFVFSNDDLESLDIDQELDEPERRQYWTVRVFVTQHSWVLILAHELCVEVIGELFEHKKLLLSSVKGEW